MVIQLNNKIWMYVEKLYIHVHDGDKFVEFLNSFDIKFENPVYKRFKDDSKFLPVHSFMSDENYTFSDFMRTVPNYKYPKILQAFLFDETILNTKDANWNYFGEEVKEWYPKIIDLLNLAGIEIDSDRKELIIPKIKEEEVTEDFLKYSFGDPFLDYMRKEINECHKNDNPLSVMFLSRKILETLFIRIFEVVFPKIVSSNYSEENHSLWYSKKNGRFRNFEELIENLKNKSDQFDEDNLLILEICSKVRPFKNETNAHVHRDYKIPDNEDISSLKIDKIINLVRKLYKKYCNP